MPAPIFNLIPAQGEPARFGFEVAGVPVVLTTKVLPERNDEVEVSVHYDKNAGRLCRVESGDVLGHPGVNTVTTRVAAGNAWPKARR